MTSLSSLTALEVENQLLSSSRIRWIAVASELRQALNFKTASIEQQISHSTAIKQYNLLLEDEKSTFPSSLPSIT